jgi:RND family efflux transporter MFP subunit
LNASFPHDAGARLNENPRSSLAAGARRRLRAGILIALLAVALAVGCNEAPPAGQEKKTVEVIATTPITSEVADYQDFTGRLDALMSVDIRARVTGFVMTAPFKEGDMVNEGDLLFQIDPRTYQATLNQAEANLKQAVADRNLQEKNSVRARRLVEGRSISQEDYDTTVATFDKSGATVGAMEAARDMARLYLDFTRVTAPLTGRISRRFVDPGNLVMADNTVLTTIVAGDSLYAYFDIDERTYLELMDTASPGGGSWLAGLQFPVLMRLANQEEFKDRGTINFIDNRVNATTGTIRVRGVFDNASGILKPGLFVRIRLPIGKPYEATLISSEALLSDQGRKYVYIVNDHNEVVYRPVTPGQETHGLAVIKKGLSRGDRVIVSGMQRVKQGAQVQVKMREPPKPPASSLVQLFKSQPTVQVEKQPDKANGGKETGRKTETRKEAAGAIPGGS